MRVDTDMKLEAGQVVALDGSAGFFRITDVPDHGRHVVLYGGVVQRRGGIKAGSRTVVPAKVVQIDSKATMLRAKTTLHAIDEAMEAASRPHNRKAGTK